MDFFSVLSMIGGLAMFLYGMNTMGDGLAKTAGGKMESILEKLTSTPLKGVLLGAVVTAVIQSSSATTVMVVGFVNSGIMKLSQAVGIIMGANVGTTITSWILSLSGIQSDSFFIRLLKPTSFSPVLAFIGVILLLFTKNSKKKDIGTILLGFAVLMYGMDLMSGAVKPLADVPEFTGLFTMFSNPFLGMLVGALLTAVIQSSSASVGILQALCVTGSVTYGAAIPIIMGQNIGTCVTALISAIGAKKNARRTAFVHLYFNIIGTILFMVIFYGINIFLSFAFLNDAANAAGIAVVHSAFNIAATIVLLPFAKGLERLACLTVRDTEEEAAGEKGLLLLDDRFLEKPAFAVAQAKMAGFEMAELAKRSLLDAASLLNKYDEDKAERVVEIEGRVDHYEDELGTYLMKISSKDLSEDDSRTVSILLHCIGDFERISDHARNIKENAEEMHKKGLAFSETAKKELEVFHRALTDIVERAIEAFETQNVELAKKVEPIEAVIDTLNDELKKRHIERLRRGVCTIELGFVLSDLTTNYERVADHCSNIAVCLIEAVYNGFETHEYLEKLREEGGAFDEMFEKYEARYELP